MKKTVSLLLVALLLVSLAAPALAISKHKIKPGMTLYVHRGVLNVRDSASHSGRIIFKLPNHTPVDVISKPENGYVLVEFKYNGKFASGFVSVDYVNDEKPRNINKKGAYKPDEHHHDTPTPSGETVRSLNFRSYRLIDEDRLLVVTPKPSRVGGTVNVRWVPSTEAALIARLRAGDELTVIAEGHTWYQVRLESGYVGFIYKRFTEVIYDGAYPEPEEEAGEAPAEEAPAAEIPGENAPEAPEAPAEEGVEAPPEENGNAA